MKYRQLRKIDTGQWVDVLFTVDGPGFSVPLESHQADIARALGLAPAALEVRDADSDVRVGTRLAVPPPPPTPPSAAEIAQAQAIDTAAGDVVTELDKAFLARTVALTAAEKDAVKSKVVSLIKMAQGR